MTALTTSFPLDEVRGLVTGEPPAVERWVRSLAESGDLTKDDLLDALRTLRRSAHRGGARACTDAGDAVVAIGRTCGVVDGHVLVKHAQLLAGDGRGGDAAASVIAAARASGQPVRDAEIDEVLRVLAPYGNTALGDFQRSLHSAGISLAADGSSDDARAVLQRLAGVRGADGIDRILDVLTALGGFPDVVAAGKAFQLLRGASGRAPQHVSRLVQLCTASCGLSPRIVDDALAVLSEMGAPEATTELLATAEAHEIGLSDNHRLKVVLAHTNANRCDEAVQAYAAYVAGGGRESTYARRLHLQALVWSERTTAAKAELVRWAKAVGVDGVEAPSPKLVKQALSLVAREDPSGVKELLTAIHGVVPLDRSHLRVVLAGATGSLDVEELAEVLLVFSQSRVQVPAAALRNLAQRAAREAAPERVTVLRSVCEGVPTAWGACGDALVDALVETGDLETAVRAATATGSRASVERVALALLDARDVPGALSASRIAVPAEPGELPYTPRLTHRLIGALSSVDGVEAAEEWLSAHDVPPGNWPVEAWESLARSYRRSNGRHSKIDELVRRMRRFGVTPSADVWAEWLAAHPRARRVDRLQRARAVISHDGVPITAAFVVAAVTAAMTPEKVVSQPGDDPEAAVERATRTALQRGEEVLHDTLREMRSGDDPQHLSRAQLVELARTYPLKRRPYAQLDAAVEASVASLEGDDALAALLVAVAEAHARARNADGVSRIRRTAGLLHCGDLPELQAAAIDAVGEDAAALREVVLSVLGGRGSLPHVVCSAMGRALATCQQTDALEELLTGGLGHLEAADRQVLASAATSRLAALGALERARELARTASAHGLVLSVPAQAALIGAHRAEPVAGVADSEGPLWTTAELAAYNELLAHEYANHLGITKSDIKLLDTIRQRLDPVLRRPDAAVDLTLELDELADIVISLRSIQDQHRKTLSKIKAAAELERRSAGAVPVLEVVESVVEQLTAAAAEARSQVLPVDPASWGQLAVRTHATLLQFALHNLVTNALKAHKRRGTHTQRPVELLATFAQADAEDLDIAPHGWVVISVRDHGDGVRSDLPENVANWSIPGQPGLGQGIGLRVTENMIRNAHGELWVDTTVSDGSRFCIRLPAARRKHGPTTGRPPLSPPTTSPSNPTES